MGRRGKRPEPTVLKVARGTHRPTRHGRPADTIGVTIGLPEAPESLGESGRGDWVRFGRIMESLGLLEERFLPILEQLCETADRIAWAKADIESKGRVQIAESGYECPRPAVAIEKEARDERRRLLVEIGLTPASAANVKITRDSKPAGVKVRPF